MKKVIKQYGTSNIIRISPEELRIYNLKVGDVIDIKITPDKTRRVIKSK